MNLTLAKFVGKSPPHSRVRLGSMFVMILCVFLFTAVPALADAVQINQVVQSLTSSQGRPDLRLNTLVSQDPATKGSAPQTQTGPGKDSQAANQGGTKAESILSGISVNGEGQQIGVEVVEEGEVEGTICDCGEILVAGAAFPKWPFLFLGAVPLVFINDCDKCEDTSPTPTPTPTPPSVPTPTPTPPGVPEPASLLLFGTGLAAFGAGLRRRYAKAKLAEQIKGQEEE